jgi:hypothetical protein
MHPLSNPHALLTLASARQHELARGGRGDRRAASSVRTRLSARPLALRRLNASR